MGCEGCGWLGEDIMVRDIRGESAWGGVGGNDREIVGDVGWGGMGWG